MSGGAVSFVTNNGDIAGGEVMLFAMARAARDLGCEVSIVAPSTPRDVLLQARTEGFRAIEILAESRPAYLSGLRRWLPARGDALLWCNGLVPALATAGANNRVVHLHQVPRGRLQRVAQRLGSRGARRLFVPSADMASRIAGATPLANWSEGVQISQRHEARSGEPLTLGFLGRHSPGKGLDIVAQALAILNGEEPGRYRLLLAGDGRSVTGPDRAIVQVALDGVRHLVVDAGWQTREEFFSAVDLAVFPSRFLESFGLVAAEAMSCRVPFVISDAGALPEVAGAAHRWAARAGDPVSLAQTIKRAIAEVTAADLDVLRARWELEYSPAAGRDRLAAALSDLGVLPPGAER